MKNILIIILSLLSVSLFSQNNDFTITKEIPHTSIKDQAISGTCWSFATTSFIESEVKRLQKLDIDLSEMFTVKHIYKEKIITHARMQGYNFLTEGGQSHNVFFVLKHFGAMPEEVFPGVKIRNKYYDHRKLKAEIKKMMVDTLKNYTKGIVPQLFTETDSILEQYIGAAPKEFTYKLKKYTAKKFSEKVLKINSNDYIVLTSYTHNPYYKGFVLKDKYNWALNTYYNIPLKEFMQVVDNAIKTGYSICWNGDVSEKGFNFREGKAEILSEKIEINTKTRQKLYDNQQTTVDHLMHIVGTAKNNQNQKYFYVKNSWNTQNKYKGYMFMSQAYFTLKTVSICVHKKSIPKNILSKIKLNY